MHARRILFAKLHGVADQVLKELDELRFVGKNDGQRRTARHDDAAFADDLTKIVERFVEGEIRADWRGSRGPGFETRVFEEATDERHHPLRAVDRMGDVTTPS